MIHFNIFIGIHYVHGPLVMNVKHDAHRITHSLLHLAAAAFPRNNRQSTHTSAHDDINTTRHIVRRQFTSMGGTTLVEMFDTIERVMSQLYVPRKSFDYRNAQRFKKEIYNIECGNKGFLSENLFDPFLSLVLLKQRVN